MKHSEFHSALRDAFGALGPSLASDLVLDGLNQTSEEALAAGIDPQVVWDALCQTAELPVEQRFPHRADRRRPAGE